MSFAASYREVIKINEQVVYPTSTACLEGSGLNDIFHWYAHPTTLLVSAKFCRTFIWVTDKGKKGSGISKDLHLALKFSRNVANKIRNNTSPKIEPWGHPLALSAIQMFGHLKSFFEAYQKENFWIDITKNLRSHKNVIWKLVPHAKPYQKY